MESVKVVHLIDNVTDASKVGEQYSGPWNESRVANVQATITGSGAVAVNVNVYGTNTQGFKEQIGSTLVLSGSDSDSATLSITSPWAYVWAEIDSQTGTGAKTNVNMSV